MPTRRTCSYSSLQEESTDPRGRSRSPADVTTQDAVGVIKPTRFRRASFALSGERQTTMDDLVDSASREASTAAAAHEAATLSALVSPHPESGLTIPDEDALDSKRVSISTIVAGQQHCIPVPFLSDSTDRSGWSGGTYPPGRKVSMDSTPMAVTDKVCGWQNTQILGSSPLRSEVIQNYLAALAVDSEAEERSPSPPSPSMGSTMVCENVPGLFKQSVASMTMPVHQIRRAHMSVSAAPHSGALSVGYPIRTRPAKSMRYDLPRHAFTDNFNSSSCTSDVEGWPSRTRGYMSDNPIDEADPRAKELRLTGQRLEAEFHRTSKSVPRSPKTKRSPVVTRGGLAEALAGFGPAPTSHNVSSFDVSRVYEGLPSPQTPASTNSLNFETFRSTLTPPSTPTSSRSVSSLGADSGGSMGSGVSRLFSLLGSFKPKQKHEDPESFIYMDEETCERRARARASNVISPVTF